ncbi:hypothetical protein ACFL3Z_00120 [Gemmatimonadota bacterium]
MPAEDKKAPSDSIPDMERRRLIGELSKFALVAPVALVLTRATKYVAFTSG